MASPAALPYLVAIATAAAIIASQATISGAFSVTRQAVQLDLLPRVKILQTSADAHGQIYVPATNAFMFFATCAFVVIFQGSSALSGAYGAAVNGTMVITTHARRDRRARGVEVADLARGRSCSGCSASSTSRSCSATRPRSRAAAGSRSRCRPRCSPCSSPGATGARCCAPSCSGARCRSPNCRSCCADVARVPGTAVFLVSHQGFVPTAMLRNLEHNRVCHENIVILNLEIQRTPRQDVVSRSYPEEVFPGIHIVHARFGFMETPDVSVALAGARAGAACASTRTARSSSAGTWCAPARATASPA